MPFNPNNKSEVFVKSLGDIIKKTDPTLLDNTVKPGKMKLIKLAGKVLHAMTFGEEDEMGLGSINFDALLDAYKEMEK